MLAFNRTPSVRSLVLAVGCLVALVTVSPVSSGTPDHPSRQRQDAEREMADFRAMRRAAASWQVLASPFYSIADETRSRLLLLNKFGEPLDVEVTALSLEGERFPLGQRTLEPQEHLDLDLAAELATAGHAFLRGSLQVRYLGDAKMVQSWVVVRRGGQVRELELRHVGGGTNSELLSFWDSSLLDRERKITPRYYVHNAAEAAIMISAAFGNSATETVHEEVVAAGASIVLTPHPSWSRGWLRLTHDGPPGAAVVEGQLEGADFLASLPVVVSADLRGPGAYDAVRLPLASPADAVGRAIVSLFNPNPRGAAQPLALTVLDQRSGSPLLRVEERLGPQEIKSLDLAGLLLEQGGLLPTAEVRVAVEGRPGSVVPMALSYGAGAAAIDVPFFPRHKAHASGTYPIPAFRDFESWSTIVNLGRRAARVVGQLSWPGGTYSLEPVHLAPGASFRLDLPSLLRENQPDLLGRTLDPNAEQAFLQWTVLRGSQELIARTEVRPRGSEDVFGFNCFGCCEQIPYGEIIPVSVTFNVGERPLFQACEFVNTCTGTMGPYFADSPTLTYSAPMSWDGVYVSASGPSSQEMKFSSESIKVMPNCTSVPWPIGDVSPAVAVRVDILAVSLPDDKIQVRLNPLASPISGLLKITLRDSQAATQTRVVVNQETAAGTHIFGFGTLSTYTNGHDYKEVFAEWYPQGVIGNPKAIFQYRFKVLGDYRHTRYNTPTESFCTGSLQSFCYTSAGCGPANCSNWQTSSAKSGWLTQVAQNGSGSHSMLGFVSREWVCSTPAGCTTKVRQVPSPCPACTGLTVIPGATVAVQEGHGELQCGNKAFVDGLGTFTVTDTGGNLANLFDQLDHYAGISGCRREGGDAVPGTRKTFKLFQ